MTNWGIIETLKEVESIKAGRGFWVNGSSTCSIKNENSSSNTLAFDLSTDLDWSGSFADYSDSECSSDNCDKVSEYRDIPNSDKKGYFLQSDNHSDDMFMFIHKKIDNLKPHTTYKTELSVSFLSQYCNSMAGIGGSPATSNYIQMGVAPYEINISENTLQSHKLNIDKGNQASDGESTIQIGHIGIDCENGENTDEKLYPKTLTNSDKEFSFTTNENGEAWVLVGNDSGFEGLTKLYFTDIALTLTETKNTLVVDKSFEAKINQTFSTESGDLIVTVKDIVDSRCPASTVCVTAGEAKVTLTVTGTKEIMQTPTLSTDNNTITTAQGYDLILEDTQPFPQNEAYSKDKYKITLKAQKN